MRQNKLKALEGGVFTGVPALTWLDITANMLESMTYDNVLPLMDNLVNNTHSRLDISGKLLLLRCKYSRFIINSLHFFAFRKRKQTDLRLSPLLDVRATFTHKESGHPTHHRSNRLHYDPTHATASRALRTAGRSAFPTAQRNGQLSHHFVRCTRQRYEKSNLSATTIAAKSCPAFGRSRYGHCR